MRQAAILSWIPLVLASAACTSASSHDDSRDGSASGGNAGAGGATSSGGSGESGGSSTPPDAAAPRSNPCIEAGTCPPGVWVDVTPSGVDLTNTLGCGNYGTESVQADAHQPGDFYTLFMCQGIWASNDFGQTWRGPINTGTNGATAGDCAGGITIAPHNGTTPPTIYQSCIRGAGIGFWRSDDGGVSFTLHQVGTDTTRQDYYPPVVDPYDERHLVMAGHEMNVLMESADAGDTWTPVGTDPGMAQNGGTAAIFFIDTGNAVTTRKMFLWIGQQSTVYGTWRTEDGGVTWVKVDKNEHPHGNSQIYQPDSTGVVYMAGAYSDFGWGVVRSMDYGKTWAHAGIAMGEAIVFGTPKNVYSMAGGAVGLGGTLDPSLEVAPQPGTGTWTQPGTPPEMKLGPGQAAIANDGTRSIIVTANWGSGVWRYAEP